ncbi:FMN-binding protein [Anaerococcus sp. AGMB00486]|uniref:FMN-binding protein n=2 Tax=Anaerococcus TaxID=165779 RepID=A0ABX2NBS2_9FIRM|nr:MULTISPECIES: FMN-binding protein [Anaerococcus]MDY3005816.1 FMN-binding protein [Anaerococcus porci]MSS78671.1 FMN-binding protein [Anaerococcus porci]NVF12172.1 FMN-binding protein [Anaerococcus faecalis]
MHIKKIIAVGVLALALTACGKSKDSAEAAKTGTASAEGYGGNIEVTVKLDDAGKIVNIERKSEETDKVGEVALDELTEKLKGKDSTADIESVSGATVSSEAFLKAVDEAIANAK